MAEGSSALGILVLVIMVCAALAYIFLFNHKPSIGGTNSGNTITPGTNGITKTSAHNSSTSNGNGQNNSTTAKNATRYGQQIYSVPVLISNPQPSLTPPGFQDMIVVPSYNYSEYINKNWNNVEFTTGPEGGGDSIEAWIESNATSSAKATIVWLKLPASISADNTTTVYMDFMNFQVLSRSGPTGEAPQISSVYSQYDNGGAVFNFYDNFTGRTLNKNLWSNASAFASNPIIVNDGLTIGEPVSKENNGYSAVLSLQAFGRGVVDFYGTILDNSTQPHYQDVGLVPASSNGACNLIDVGSFYGPGYNGLQTVDSYCTTRYSQGLSFGSPKIYSIFVPDLNPINATATVDYANPVTSSFTSLLLPQTIGLENQGDGGNLGPIYWVRQRDYPPGGVMPDFAFGRIQ
jgi:hypothetical protein